jgi:aryl-alcohol dehydrogenase-like predicted oxidoreductase
MLTRREWLALTAGAGAAWSLDARLLFGQSGSLITRPIPSTGERVPAVGLGSSATFAQVARSEDVSALKEVFKTMLDLGGTVFDTAPSYGASEEVAGRLVSELGMTDKVFWATKVNVAGRGGGTADRSAALAQIETSFQRLKKPKIDLIQVHNLGDIPTQLGLLKELKQQGRIRYLGVTTTSDRQYAELEQVMRNEPLDFIEIDYSIANRNVEETILPLAQQRRIGVMVAVPFGRASLFGRVRDKALPPWAADYDVKSWAQYFLKFLIGHPAVTVAIPATSKAANMRDNMGGAMGRLPDEAGRRRMVEYFESVAAPAAPRPA